MFYWWLLFFNHKENSKRNFENVFMSRFHCQSRFSLFGFCRKSQFLVYFHIFQPYLLSSLCIKIRTSLSLFMAVNISLFYLLTLQEMIADNEQEQLRLIKTIFSEEATVSFLAPHFSPHHRLRTFLSLYVSVTEYFSPEAITTSFVLLSKFDIRSWLSLEPSLSERIFFARTVIAAVAKFGVEPSNELEMLFCLYRAHFVFLLSHKFPRQYSEVLHLMVEASDKETLPFPCWGDFLNVIRCDNEERSLSPSYEYVELGTDEVIGTVDWLADVFAKISQARYHSNSKLYTAWRLYIPYVARFLKFLFTKLIVHYDSCGFPSTIAKERYFFFSIPLVFSDLVTFYSPPALHSCIHNNREGIGIWHPFLAQCFYCQYQT